MLAATDLLSTYNQAERLLAGGELRKAADLCKSLLDNNPEFPYGYHLMSSLFRATGSLPQALAFSQVAIQKAPDVISFHIQHGQVLFALEQWREAAKAFKTAHALDKNNVLPLLLWADTMARDRQFERSFELFRQARAVADIPEIDEHEGLCLLIKGHRKGAEALFDRLIERKPGYAGGYIHKGKLLMDRNRYDEAEASFARALKCDPNAYEALHHMGLIHDLQDHADIAVRYVTQAIQVHPKAWQSYFLLANMFYKKRNYAGAEQAVSQAHSFAATNPVILQFLVSLLILQGKLPEALKEVDKLLLLTPDDPSMLHFRSMLRGEKTETAPAAYVAGLFDAYADQFEHHLLQGLSYKLPQRFSEILRSLPEVAPASSLSLLDLGCGTGLGAQPILDITSRRVGVDLSEKMIEKAQAKECYAELHVGDIVEFMLQSKETFDLLIATDVLNYIGNLAPVLKAARNVMAVHSLFTFSLENETSDESFKLHTTGRYKHRPDYIEKMVRDEGFVLVKREELILRTDHYIPVQGSIYVLKKAQAH